MGFVAGHEAAAIIAPSFLRSCRGETVLGSILAKGKTAACSMDRVYSGKKRVIGVSEGILSLDKIRSGRLSSAS